MTDEQKKAAKKPKKVKLLFCVNDRGAGRRSCAGSGANSLRKEAKALAADMPGIKVKKSDCLGLCKHGPVIEVLPAKLYYQVRDTAQVVQLMAELEVGKPVTVGPIRTGKSAKKA